MSRIIGAFFVVFLFIAAFVAGDYVYSKVKEPEEKFDVDYDYFTERMLNVSVIPKQTSTIYSITMNNGHCDYATVSSGPGKPKNPYPLTLERGENIVEPFWCRNVMSIEIYTDKGTYIYEY